MADVVYAVHTRACTYLLDGDGVCVWVLSRRGLSTDDRCVGAQFVACLDVASEGGLVGELRAGAMALFVHVDDGRFALLKTKPIELVEMKGDTAPDAPEPDPYEDVRPEETASLPGIGEDTHARIVEAARAAWREDPPLEPPRRPVAPHLAPAGPPPSIPQHWVPEPRPRTDPPPALDSAPEALPFAPAPVPTPPPTPRVQVEDLRSTRPEATRTLAHQARAAVVAVEPELPRWVTRQPSFGSGFRVEPPGGAPAADFDPKMTGERMEISDEDVMEISSEITITNPLFRPSTKGRLLR